jgi:hypothetical protein
MIELERLIDHHCHGVDVRTLSRPRLEALMSEAHRPEVPGCTQFDKPLGLVIRRFCAPVLGLEPHSAPEDYVARRTELGGEESSRRLMHGAGTSDLLIDTGHRSGDILDVPGMAALSGAFAREVVRIEAVMEQAARTASSGEDLLSSFEATLAERASKAVGLKSIVAYRTTFDIDQSAPGRAEAAAAGDAWLRTIAASGWRRLEDPTLIRHGLYVALDLCVQRKFPLQLHVGVGDRDVDMPKCDPTLFVPFILQAEAKDVPIALLHCYPFVQESAWMAEVFSNVYFDVGFTLNFTGAMARRAMEDALGMGPFFKQLYSSDAFGLAELHHLGRVQFQRALSAVLSDWIAAGDCTTKEAERTAAMISHANAERIYRL